MSGGGGGGICSRLNSEAQTQGLREMAGGTHLGGAARWAEGAWGSPAGGSLIRLALEIERGSQTETMRQLGGRPGTHAIITTKGDAPNKSATNNQDLSCVFQIWSISLRQCFFFPNHQNVFVPSIL